jgi:stage V sporulation protein R
MNETERAELEKWIDIIWEKAHEMGLDPYPTHFEVVPDHIIYELGAYGLPARFSHWTFGRDYHRQKTSYEYGMSKIYEIVFNTDPTQAFLLDSNNMLSHKLVVAHVLGHSDFFKRNTYFRHTDRRMIEKVRLHAQRLHTYEQQQGPLVVEKFLDAVLSVEEHFDPTATVYRRKTEEEYERDRLHPSERTSEYDDLWKVGEETPARPTSPPPRKFPPEPEKDILRFLRDYAPDLEDWQRDVINIVREEMFYFLPQIRTKVQNEGWACATGNSLLVTERGFLRFKDIYERQASLRVSSGKHDALHPITAFHKEANVPTIRVTTRRGYTIEGALKHRVQKADGSWAYLKDIRAGERIALAHNTGIWPDAYIPLRFTGTPRTASLQNIAEKVGVSLSTVLRHRQGRKTLTAQAIEETTVHLGYSDYAHGKFIGTRTPLRLPAMLEEDLAYLLGYFIGDGNFTKSGIELTCKDADQAKQIACLLTETTGLPATLKHDVSDGHSRWRVITHSREFLGFLQTLGMDRRITARLKIVPDAVLQSPQNVMSAFLRGYFDADGYAGKCGVILSTSSRKLAHTVQVILLNYGILSTQRLQGKGIINLEIRGASAVRFREAVGFDLARKRQALDAYVDGHHWFKREETTDEVVSITGGHDDVYDITVEEAHAYAANGLIHHNSFWHERILTELPLTPEEHWGFRRMHASVLSPGSKMSINPYYVGYQILRDIERRWNGEVDPDDPEEDWRGEVIARPQGQGMQKLFEVVADESDVSFLRKYLTKKLVRDLDMYTYKLEEVGGELVWVVQETDWRKVRDALVESMTNFGAPVVMVEDGDYDRHRELYLKHYYDGKPLDTDYTARTLKSIHLLWGRPVHLETVAEDAPVLLTYDGEEFTEMPL